MAEHETISVKGYWRLSVKGRWHWVNAYRRGVSGAREVCAPPSHSAHIGHVRQVSRLITSEAEPFSKPWVEIRYVLRYRTMAGKKVSRYIPRVMGEAWRARAER